MVIPYFHPYSMEQSLIRSSLIFAHIIWNSPSYSHPPISTHTVWSSPLYGHPSSPPIQYGAAPYMVILHLCTYSMEQSLIWSSLIFAYTVWNRPLYGHLSYQPIQYRTVSYMDIPHLNITTPQELHTLCCNYIEILLSISKSWMGSTFIFV